MRGIWARVGVSSELKNQGNNLVNQLKHRAKNALEYRDGESHDGYVTDGIRIEDATLNAWLNYLVPTSQANRQVIIDYANGALNW